MPIIATETGKFNGSYSQAISLNTTVYRKISILVLLIAVYALVPLFASEYWLTVLNLIGVASVGALGLNILVGYTGQISLGQAAFAAVGAYTVGNIVSRTDLPFYVAIVAGMAVAGLVSLLFGIAAIRVSGLYLAIATLAAQYVVQWVLNNWSAVTGGYQGVLTFPVAELGPWSTATAVGRYFLIMICLGLSVAFAVNLMRSRTGRAFIAIRDQDVAAAGAGISVFRYKMKAFFISSALAGLAGGLYGYNVGLISTEMFTITLSVQFLAMILVGGLGSIAGAILGAAFLTLLPIGLREGLNALSLNLPTSLQVHIVGLLTGLAILGFLILEPKGLYGLYRKIKDYFRMWPFSY